MPAFAPAFAALLAGRDTATDVRDAVAAIVAAVRTRGDAALIEYTARFDRLELTADALRISADEIDAADAAASRRTCTRRSTSPPRASTHSIARSFRATCA